MTVSTSMPARGRPAENVLAAIRGTHWAITPEALETICAIASRMNPTPEALEAQSGEPLENTWSMTVRDGVATLEMRGPMLRYGSWIGRCSGATSYEDAIRDFTVAVNDPAIRAIILSMNTPGGSVDGCSEFSRMVHDALDVKPVDAYVGGQCSSAGMWIASACRRIIVADTALLGSLGCVYTYEDSRRRDKADGIDQWELVSSQTPRKRPDPATPEGAADLQAIVDSLAEVFLDAVAEYNGVTRDEMPYADGRTVVGAAAVEIGMADAVGSYESLLAELVQETNAASAAPSGLLVPGLTAAAAGGRTITSSNPESSMPTSATRRRGAAPQAAAPTPEDKDKNKGTAAADSGSGEPGDDDEEDEGDGAPPPDDGKKRDDPQDSTDATKAAAAAERARILAIQGLQLDASEAEVINACIADGSTVEAAALKLRQKQTAAGSPAARHLASLRADERNAPAPRTLPSGSGEESSVEALADSIATAGASKRTPIERPAR